jgi:hypothetical protein
MFPGERSLDASLVAVFVQRPTHAMSLVPRMPTLTAKLSPSSIPQPMSKPSVPAALSALKYRSMRGRSCSMTNPFDQPGCLYGVVGSPVAGEDREHPVAVEAPHRSVLVLDDANRTGEVRLHHLRRGLQPKGVVMFEDWTRSSGNSRPGFRKGWARSTTQAAPTVLRRFTEQPSVALRRLTVYDTVGLLHPDA